MGTGQEATVLSTAILTAHFSALCPTLHTVLSRTGPRTLNTAVLGSLQTDLLNVPNFTQPRFHMKNEFTPKI